MKKLFLLPLVFLMACTPDETISAYAVTGQPYTLTEMNDAPVTFRATIEFGDAGAFSGMAPCNRYFGQNEDPYPWVNIQSIGATKVACPQLKEESLYFRALESMTLAEASGPVLILSNDAGDSMVFQIER